MLTSSSSVTDTKVSVVLTPASARMLLSKASPLNTPVARSVPQNAGALVALLDHLDLGVLEIRLDLIGQHLSDGAAASDNDRSRLGSSWAKVAMARSR